MDQDGWLTLDDVGQRVEEDVGLAIDVADAAVINYVISRLDELAQQSTEGLATGMTELLGSIRALRDLLRHVAQRLAAGDEYEGMFLGPAAGTRVLTAVEL